MPPHTPTTQLLNSYNHQGHQLTGKRIWLACSGGRDSMALAFATFQLYLQGKLPFCPQLVHVNHGLQSANDEWADMVADWAKSVGLPCHIVHANMHKKLDGTDEQSARNARYKAISSLMNQHDVLMLAHHANDQAETVLMRLFNGAGVAGLSGIGEWSTKRVQSIPTTTTVPKELSIGKQIHLWRPWLNISREQITDFAHEHNLPYVNDPTNLTGNNVRSWLRTELMPTIKQTYPKAVNSIIRSASLLDEANDILAEVYQQDLQICISREVQFVPYDLILNIDKVKQLSIARQRQLIHRWLQGDEPTPASKQRVDEIFQLIHRDDNDQQAELLWQGVNYQYSVRRYRQQLHRLRGDWLVFLQGYDIKKNLLVLDNEKINIRALTIRLLRKTDKFALNPRQKAQSGKKLMQLLGIPMWERKMVYVLKDEKREGEVIAVITPREMFGFLIDIAKIKN